MHTRTDSRALARLVLAFGTIVALALPAGAAPAPGTYSWPVRGPVLRPFSEPAGPFGPGHRGIDIGVPFGTVIRAPQDGVVAFAGWVAGSQFVSIDHPDGVRTTYSWLSSISVSRGGAVLRGDVIAHTGHGHPGESQPHLHLGARFEGRYIDPLMLLEVADVAELIRLAPLEGAGPGRTLGPAAGTLPSGRVIGARTMAALPDSECDRCRLSNTVTFPRPRPTSPRAPPSDPDTE